MESEKPTMPALPPSLSALQRDVAIVVGGGGDPLAEYAEAKALCIAAGKTFATFVCNDTIPVFPDDIDHGCTLHPDKYQHWRMLRERFGRNPPKVLWAHRSYTNFHHHTKDWQGSSGLFMVKVARELGYTHIIACGVPMRPEAKHFARNQVWNACQGFRRGWARVQGSLRPFLRSMSGWTMEHFGKPDAAWLAAEIPDPFPMTGLHDHSGVKA